MKSVRLLTAVMTLVVTLTLAVVAIAAASTPSYQGSGEDDEEALREIERSLEAEEASAAATQPRPSLAPLTNHEGPLFIGVDDTTIPAYRLTVPGGVATPVFDGVQVWGAAYDPDTNRVYFNSGTQLWQWPVGGVAALVGTITIGGNNATMVGLAFYDGTLYGVGNIGTENIYAIDTTTAVATEAIIVQTTTAERDFGGLDIDPESGKMYATNDAAALHGMVEIAPDGTVTVLAPYPDDQTDIDGLAVGGGRAYLVTDEPGNIYVYDFATESYTTPIPNPWTTAEVFSAGAWIDPAAGSRQLFCSSPALPIPDNHAPGTSTDLVISVNGAILDLNVELDVSHTWVGDLSFELEHVDSGTLVPLLSRPGVPATTFGCSGDNIQATINDEGVDGAAESTCLAAVPTISGHLVGGDPPNTNLLASFDGEDLGGTWRLQVSDVVENDTGTVNEWCLSVVVDPPVVAVNPAQLASTQAPAATVTRTLEIGNTGAGLLQWNVGDGTDATCTGDLPWLSTSPITGTVLAGTTSEVTVAFDSTGLASGDYDGYLCVNSSDPETPLVAVPVLMTVEDYELFLPMLRR
jgi:subtilisin-like proprotein convertase family protein